MTGFLTIDGRAMEPPEPLELILDQLPALGPDDRLLARLRHEPFPLYDILAARGYRWSTRRQGPGDFLVEIRLEHS